jgi:transcriptional regulator with GAF, ATPase, and Fis domain
MPTLNFDDNFPRIDALITELSSDLCALGNPDLAPIIETALAHVAEAVSADAATFVLEGDKTGDAKMYRWVNSDAATAGEPSDGDMSWLWDRLPLDQGPVVLNRIPGDLPSATLTPDVLEMLRRVPLQAAVIVPIMIAGERACILVLEAHEPRTWPPALVTRLRLLAEILTGALYRHRQDVALRDMQSELARATTDHTAAEPEPEPREDDAHGPPLLATFSDIVGESGTLRAALKRVQEVGPTKSTVLLLGETGTGKELFARAIHARSLRRANAFVVINCAALPPSLIESELFGHTRGAFTGAVATRQGRFELAHRGTLFLDEIGDLPLDLQTKLLRVLQEGTFERLGSSQAQKVDVRIITATHRDLHRMITEGTFREDLYYRLSVFPIRLPPLRERREDIPALIWSIIRKRERATHRSIRRVPDGVMEQLKRRNWPGNVRELENVIERALIHTTGDTLTLLEENLEVEAAPPEDATSLSSVERTHIQQVLRACNWRINGVGNAAERLGLHPNTLRFRMKKLGIVREDGRGGVRVASA